MRIKWMLVVALLALLGIAAAAAVGGTQIFPWAVAGGGGESTGDGYSVVGTIGQQSAGVSSGEGYTLSSGFLVGAQTLPHYIYIPVIRR